MSLVVLAVLALPRAGIRQVRPADDDERREHEEHQQSTARAGWSQGLHSLVFPRSHAPNYRHERAALWPNAEIAHGGKNRVVRPWSGPTSGRDLEGGGDVRGGVAWRGARCTASFRPSSA